MNLDKVNSTQDLNDSFFIIKALNGNILAVEAITKFNDIDSAEHRAASILSSICSTSLTSQPVRALSSSRRNSRIR